MTSIKCGNCGNSHESVAIVRTCHGASGKLGQTELPIPSDDELVATVRQAQKRTFTPATEKQIAYIWALLRDRSIEELGADRATAERIRRGEEVTKESASDLIITLKQAPRVTVRHTEDVPEGIHYVDGTVLKVQVAIHGSGRKYVKELNTDTGKFEYVGSRPLSRLSEDTLMKLEDAQEFGKLYGMCLKCGRTLTDEESIARGIGPICAEGWA